MSYLFDCSARDALQNTDPAIFLERTPPHWQVDDRASRGCALFSRKVPDHARAWMEGQ
jgi:hypothetical protein